MSAVDINALKAQVESEAAAIDSAARLEEFRVKYLGRKGVLAELTASIPGLPKEERATFGQQANLLKNKITALIEERQKNFGTANLQARVNAARPETVDITLPGIAQELGQLHPITRVINDICAIFTRMGFSVLEGPEIESEYNNFTGLNIPLDHPSRDAFDTFYLKGNNKLLLRSHTSPMQVRAMKKYKPPLAVVVPGRVYRPDATDASHLFMFYQIEGFMVDKGIKFSDLKGMLELFVKEVFGKEITMRLRPHFFPFTEPSAEVDIACTICKGKGCPSCGKKGWLEILGSGMIHPNVLKNVGYDPRVCSGFAFGMGVERIANLKYGIKDIRMFFENDLRMLKQF